MKKAIIFSILLMGCTTNYKHYEDLHQMYRTLWWRTDEECFYDSSRKYGLIVDSIIGISDSMEIVDTVQVDTIINCN